MAPSPAAPSTGRRPSRCCAGSAWPRAMRSSAQGVVRGGLLQGIKIENGAFAGGPFDWATPFSLLCGVGLAAGYALLGAGFLLMRTEGAAAALARRRGPI